MSDHHIEQTFWVERIVALHRIQSERMFLLLCCLGLISLSSATHHTVGLCNPSLLVYVNNCSSAATDLLNLVRPCHRNLDLDSSLNISLTVWEFEDFYRTTEQYFQKFLELKADFNSFRPVGRDVSNGRIPCSNGFSVKLNALLHTTRQALHQMATLKGVSPPAEHNAPSASGHERANIYGKASYIANRFNIMLRFWHFRCTPCTVN